MNRCGHVKCRKLWCVLGNKERRNCVWQQPLGKKSGEKALGNLLPPLEAVKQRHYSGFNGSGRRLCPHPDLDIQMDARWMEDVVCGQLPCSL